MLCNKPIRNAVGKAADLTGLRATAYYQQINLIYQVTMVTWSMTKFHEPVLINLENEELKCYQFSHVISTLVTMDHCFSQR